MSEDGKQMTDVREQKAEESHRYSLLVNCLKGLRFFARQRAGESFMLLTLE